MKSLLKKIIPAALWNFVRDHRDWCFDTVRNGFRTKGTFHYAGYQVCYTSGMTIVSRARKEDVFEESLSRALAERVAACPGALFLDVGSNIGLISLYVAAKVPSARIVAFDPGPMQTKLFAETIQKNALTDRVQIECIALSDTEGQEDYFIHGSREVSKDGLRDTGRGGNTHAENVRVRTLDSWWREQNRPRVSAIKIDTEGAELLVLRGAGVCIQETRPYIYLEIEPRNISAYEYSAEDVFAWFTTHSYMLRALGGEVCGNVAELAAALKKGTDSFVGEPVTRI